MDVNSAQRWAGAGSFGVPRMLIRGDRVAIEGLSLSAAKRRAARAASYGLGEEEAVDPMLAYVQSVKAAEAEANYLSAARPADWSERLDTSSRSIDAHLDELRALVTGQTGNADAEGRLLALWTALAEKNATMRSDAPSALAAGADRVARFFSDFAAGVKGALQSYSTWALKNAGPILQKFHASESRLRALRKDLRLASASGKFDAGTLAKQKAQLDAAQQKIDAIRAVFSKLSAGVSIDEVAQKEFGSYPTLEGGPAIAVSWPLAVVACVLIAAALILSAYAFVTAIAPLTDAVAAVLDRIAKSVGDSPGGFWSLGMIGLALWALPKVIDAWGRSKGSRRNRRSK